MLRRFVSLAGYLAVLTVSSAEGAPTFLIESVTRLADGNRQTGSLNVSFENDSNETLEVVGFQAQLLFGESAGVSVLGAGGIVDNYILAPNSQRPVVRFDAVDREIQFGDFLLSGSVAIAPDQIVNVGTIDYSIEPDFLGSLVIDLDPTGNNTVLNLADGRVVDFDTTNLVSGRVVATAVPEPATSGLLAFLAVTGAAVRRQRVRER